MVEERDESRKIVKRYPLVAKMGRNVFDCKPEFPSTKNSKICEKAYMLTASLQSARDFLPRIYCSSSLASQEGLELYSFS